MTGYNELFASQSAITSAVQDFMNPDVETAYRYYAAGLLERLEPNPGPFPLDLRAAQAEVESALQATTEMLSAVTRLLALVSAPPLESATIRHVEVLLLQPQAVMIVVITSTGAVTKRIYAFAEPVDPGLANWAGQYLNDTLAGGQPGTHQLRQRLEDPGLSERESAFLATLRPTFTELLEEVCYVEIVRRGNACRRRVFRLGPGHSADCTGCACQWSART